MNYHIMRFNKYYDALRTNYSFFNAPFDCKWKIVRNIIKFYFERLKKPLVLKSNPVVAQIEPTSLCNLKCAMCIRDKIGVPLGTMNFENFKIILEKLDSLFKIHLSGQGEPFLNKELFEMIKYANQRGIIVNLNTNATLLNEDSIKKICDVNIGEIAISFESTKKNEYEKIRKGAKFEEVKKNIQELTNALLKNKKKTIVSLAVTILKENIQELPEFITFSSELGIKKIIAQTIQEKEDYIKNYNNAARANLFLKYKEKLRESVELSKKIAQKKRIEFIFDEEKSVGCIWPWRSIYITWDGNVTPCCKILNYKKDGMGNLLKEDLENIWNGEKYQLIRKLLRKRFALSCCNGCNNV